MPDLRITLPEFDNRSSRYIVFVSASRFMGVLANDVGIVKFEFQAPPKILRDHKWVDIANGHMLGSNH